jgi:hypothetical protein
MALLIRMIGLARAKVKIGLANCLRWNQIAGAAHPSAGPGLSASERYRENCTAK